MRHVLDHRRTIGAAPVGYPQGMLEIFPEADVLQLRTDAPGTGITQRLGTQEP